MRKMILLAIMITLLSGCQEENEGGITFQAIELRKEIKQLISDITTQWELIDGRTEEIVFALDMNDYLASDESIMLEEEKLAKLARDLAKNIDRAVKNPRISRSGEISEGRGGVVLRERELVEQLLTMSYYNKKLYLPIYEVEPTVSVADLETIKDALIGSYSTSFNSGVQGRSVNIKLSSEAIDHYVVGPNEVFSFNSVVGQRTRERGYQEAKEIVNKQFVMGIGGGICQTSSTLYNAIDRAGLEIVERFTHSREIGYVPVGRDATVSWGGPDFKFRNPYAFPVLIIAQTSLQSGKIEVQVYASNEAKQLVMHTQ